MNILVLIFFVLFFNLMLSPQTLCVVFTDKRRQASTRIPAGTLEQILNELQKPETIQKFIRKLIPDAEIKVDNTAEKNDVVPDAASNHDNGQGKNEVESDTEICSDLVDQKEDVRVGGMRKLREWSKGSFTQNPFVLVSLALEGAGCSHVSKTFFEGEIHCPFNVVIHLPSKLFVQR